MLNPLMDLVMLAYIIDTTLTNSPSFIMYDMQWVEEKKYIGMSMRTGLCVYTSKCRCIFGNCISRDP